MKNRPYKPWLPCEYSKHDVYAIQALQKGIASPDQQQQALKFIVDVLAIAGDWPFMPESARDTDIALGRQFVGKQIIKFTQLTPDDIERIK